MSKLFRSVVCVVVCAVLPRVSSADEAGGCANITRANLVACALSISLGVREEQKNEEALQGRRTAVASVLPANPMISLTGARREARGTEPTALNWSAALSQEFEVAGQRGTRVDAVDAELSAQSKKILLRKREVASSAWRAYFDAIAGREVQGLMQDLLRASERMATVSRARTEKGLSAPIEADIADAISLRVLQRKVEADRAVVSAEANLSFLLGRDSAERPLAVEGSLVPLAGIPDNAGAPNVRGRRLEVAIAEDERKASAARARSFRRSRVPNPTLSVFAQNDGYNERVYGLGLSFPIPLPSPIGRTFAGEIAESEALAERAEIGRQNALREVKLDSATAYASYRSHLQLVEKLTPERLKRARESLRDLGTEIEAGRLAVRDALLAQQTLIDLLETDIAERRALCLASVDVAQALGLPLEEGSR